MEVIKEEQIRSREEAAASRKAAAAKHRKMLEVADKNNTKITESFDALQDKLKKNLEGWLSEERLKKMMKLLHRTGTHIKSAALTAPGPIPDETGDTRQTDPLAGREPPPVPESPELPDANRATKAGGDGGDGEAGDDGDVTDGGAGRARDATSPSSSDSSSSSSSSDSESDGRKGRKKSGKDTSWKKKDEQVDEVFWLGDLHAHRWEKKKSRKLQMNRPQTVDGDRSSKPTYGQWCSGVERYLDYHRGEWEKDADLIIMVGS